MRIFVISLLTVSMVLLMASCSSKRTIGNPYILYEIHGTVTDPQGAPVKGISVSSGDMGSDITSSNGEFVLFGRSAPSESATVICEDKDGEVNGGPFMKTSVQVQLKLRSAGDGNNKGNYFASEVVIRMIPKDEQMQDEINPPVSARPQI